MRHSRHLVNEDIHEKPLSLRPRVHEKITRFLGKEQEMVFSLIDAFGSPLNLIFPQIIAENIAGFQQAYDRHGLQGRIYCSTKPNKSLAALRQAALCSVGIDVSSEESLKTAMSCGFHPDLIECTGPKNPSYLALALQQRTIINADNFEELAKILSLRRVMGIMEKARVFVRLAGFSSRRMNFTRQDGTFGIHVDEAPAIFSFLQRYKDDLDFQGFSFHFTASTSEQKLIGVEGILKLTIEAFNHGLRPKGINIGGGYDIDYADDPEEWMSYVDTLKDSLRQENGPSLTWNNSGLGFRNEGGIIKGAPAFMEHARVGRPCEIGHEACAGGGAELFQLLATPLPAFQDQSAAAVLADCMLNLYIEPGRSVFDQLGITIGRVNHVKKSMHGETLVALDMNRSNIHATHHKLLTDPVILKKDQEQRAPCPQGVYYIGNLCLSYDMITYNKTFPNFQPVAGDLVVFINTAAYIMDFVESRTLHQRIADKIAVIEKNQRFHWFKDELYIPAIQKEG